MAILTTSLESDEAELRPCNDVTWFVLDNSLIIFQERQQRLITLDSLSSIVWQLLWGNGTADQNPYMNTIAAAAAELASQSGYTLSTALLFVRSCIEQWSDAKLISRSSQKTAARIILPRHPNPSNVNTIARLGSQFRSYWVSGVTVYVERDRTLLAAIEPVPGHVPSTRTNKVVAEISIRREGGRILGDDWWGRATVLCSPEEVVAWLKLAILEAILAALPSSIAIHAAALSRCGDAILLVGSSGSGKTTLAAYLHAHGYALIGEDAVFVDPELATISGLPFSFCTKEGSWPALRKCYPHLDIMHARTRPDGKLVKYLAPRRTLDSSPISSLRTIIFPELSATGNTNLRPMSRADALVDILREALNDQHSLTRAGFRMLCRALSDASVARLNYCDLGAALDCIESLQACQTSKRIETRP